MHAHLDYLLRAHPACQHSIAFGVNREFEKRADGRWRLELESTELLKLP